MSRISFILFIVMTILVIACSKDEGCLDIYATNFDASAEKDCCCEYPSLILNTNHVFDTVAFRLEENLTFDNIDTFQILESNLLFSNINLINNNAKYIIDDTIHVNSNSQSHVLTDDYVIIKPSKFSYNIGTFSHTLETFDQFEWLWGLDEESNQIVPDSIYIDNHALSNDTDTIWSSNEGYFLYYLKFIPNIQQADIQREIVIHDMTNSINQSFISNINNNIGYDLEINIQINYHTMLNGINFEADSETTIIQKIINNFNSSITLLE